MVYAPLSGRIGLIPDESGPPSDVAVRIRASERAAHSGDGPEGMDGGGDGPATYLPRGIATVRHTATEARHANTDQRPPVRRVNDTIRLIRVGGHPFANSISPRTDGAVNGQMVIDASHVDELAGDLRRRSRRRTVPVGEPEPSKLRDRRQRDPFRPRAVSHSPNSSAAPGKSFYGDRVRPVTQLSRRLHNAPTALNKPLPALFYARLSSAKGVSSGRPINIGRTTATDLFLSWKAGRESSSANKYIVLKIYIIGYPRIAPGEPLNGEMFASRYH